MKYCMHNCIYHFILSVGTACGINKFNFSWYLGPSKRCVVKSHGLVHLCVNPTLSRALYTPMSVARPYVYYIQFRTKDPRIECAIDIFTFWAITITFNFELYCLDSKQLISDRIRTCCQYVKRKNIFSRSELGFIKMRKLCCVILRQYLLILLESRNRQYC